MDNQSKLFSNSLDGGHRDDSVGSSQAGYQEKGLKANRRKKDRVVRLDNLRGLDSLIIDMYCTRWYGQSIK